MSIQFHKQGLCVEFIEAIDAINVKEVGFGFPSHSHQACLLSHKKAVKKAIEDNVDYAIILEDDAVLCDNFLQKVEEIISLKPKFDLIHLAHFNTNGSHCVDSIYKSKGELGTWCYLVHKDFLKELYSLYDTNEMQCDELIQKYNGNYDIYGVNPMLSYQYESFSDLIKTKIFYKIRD